LAKFLFLTQRYIALLRVGGKKDYFKEETKPPAA
jgi:hypothetical protein